MKPSSWQEINNWNGNKHCVNAALNDACVYVVYVVYLLENECGNMLRMSHQAKQRTSMLNWMVRKFEQINFESECSDGNEKEYESVHSECIAYDPKMAWYEFKHALLVEMWIQSAASVEHWKTYGVIAQKKNKPGAVNKKRYWCGECMVAA